MIAQSISFFTGCQAARQSSFTFVRAAQFSIFCVRLKPERHKRVACANFVLNSCRYLQELLALLSIPQFRHAAFLA